MERRNKKKKQRSERGKHGEKEKKRKRDVEEDRWEKYLVSQEKFIPEIQKEQPKYDEIRRRISSAIPTCSV